METRTKLKHTATGSAPCVLCDQETICELYSGDSRDKRRWVCCSGCQRLFADDLLRGVPVEVLRVRPS